MFRKSSIPVIDMIKSKTADASVSKKIFNKVPEITAYFWIIKVLCTTVGETFSDFLSESLNWGLTITSLVMTAILVIVLIFQFRAKKYIPGIYWLAVVLISVVGTLITDNLTDNLGVSLFVSTIVFAIALSITFIVWYTKEKTLSIHSIFTGRREAFYWLTILFTFALGTAVGDLISEQFNLGYPVAVLIFAGCIALVALLHYRFKMNGVLSFWIAYILTRPLGASIGDYLSQARTDGGLGLGPTTTSILFLIAILGTVIYLSIAKKDVISKPTDAMA